MSRAYAKRFSLQYEQHKTSPFPAPARAAGEAVLLPAVSELSLKQRGEGGGGDCVSAPVLFMVQRQRSQPSPALSSLTLSFINETDKSAKSRHWIQRWQCTQSGVHACTYHHRQKPADNCTMITAAGAKHKYSLSKHTQMLPRGKYTECCY